MPRVEDVRANQREETYASLKNRRLAAHMAKRLSSPQEAVTPKKTVKSRLSLPVTNRLGNRRGRQTRGRGISRKTRGQQSTVSTRGSGNAPVRFRMANQGRRASRGQNRGRGGLNQAGRGGASNRGGGTRGGFNPGVKRGKPGVRGGRGRGRGGSKKPVTQEQLDNELDKYMSKTKSVLNAQLDQYMKAAGE